MKYIYSEDKIIITNNSRIELDDLSINIPKAYSFYLPFVCNIIADADVLISSIDEKGNVVLGRELVKTDNQSFSILLESSKEGIEEIPLTINFSSGETIHFTIVQQYVDVEDRLIIACNNYGIQIDSDWMKCF